MVRNAAKALTDIGSVYVYVVEKLCLMGRNKVFTYPRISVSEWNLDRFLISLRGSEWVVNWKCQVARYILMDTKILEYIQHPKLFSTLRNLLIEND